MGNPCPFQRAPQNPKRTPDMFQRSPIGEAAALPTDSGASIFQEIMCLQSPQTSRFPGTRPPLTFLSHHVDLFYNNAPLSQVVALIGN